MIPSFGEIDTIGPRKVIRISIVLLVFLVLVPTLYSGAGQQLVYAQPALSITGVRCTMVTATQMGVGVGFVVSGVSHDSITLKFPINIFGPDGNLVPQAGADVTIITIPSNAPDPSGVTVGTNFPITPSTPAPGTYKLIVIPGGEPISATFNAPNCSSATTPDTTITSAVDGNNAPVQNGGTTFSSSIKFTFTATAGTNPIAGFQCSLDNNPFSNCNSPATFNNLAAGSHKFTVVAVDTAGNRDPTPATFTWTIPLQPPQTKITSAVDGNGATVLNGGSSVSSSIRITFSGTPGKNPIAGFECSLDRNAFSPCSSPVTRTDLLAGSHIFQVRAVDTAGNKDPTPAGFSWTILTPAQAIQQLIQTVHGMGLFHGTETTLTALLYTAYFHLIAHDVPTACVQLTAFVNLAHAYGQTGQLSLGQSAQLVRSAQDIQKALGCDTINEIPPLGD